MAKTTTLLKIEHVDSFLKDEVTQDFYDNLQPQLQAKWKITGKKETTEAPAEIDKK